MVNELRVDRPTKTLNAGNLWGVVFLLLLVDQWTVRLPALQGTDIFHWRFWANQLISALFVYGLLILLRGAFHSKFVRNRVWFCRLLLIANLFELCLFLTVQTNHYLVYQKPFSSFSVLFLLENPALTLELGTENIQILQTALRLFPQLLLFFFVLRSAERTSQPRPWTTAGGLLAFLTAVGVATFSWWTLPQVQHSLLSATVAFADVLRVPELSSAIVTRPSQMRNTLECPNISAGVPRQIPSVIWVIGESAVASRFSIYGNPRPTTEFLSEELSKGRLVRFDNAVSIGTVTRISVPYLIFGLQGPDKSGRIFSSPSIFDFAKTAGMTTAFIGAQELRWGNQDKIIINDSVDFYRSGADFDSKAGISKGADDFTVLQNGAIPYLQKVRSPFFLTLHMDGSHYPYGLHSQPQFKKFLPEREVNDLNAYDNTLVQLDAYLKELMRVVRLQHPDAWVFYSSDHGQNISEHMKFNSGYSESVIRNPLLVFPPQQRPEDDARQQKLQRQSKHPVSQADLFATTLELMGCFTQASRSDSDSLSLFAPISSKRLRIVSGLMSSHFVDHTFAIVDPDRRIFEIDVLRGRVNLPDGKSVRMSEWQSQMKNFAERLDWQ